MTLKHLLFILLSGISTQSIATPLEDEPWFFQPVSDGSSATARHEASAVNVNGKLYLLGGRSERPIEVFDPETKSWQNLGSTPIEMNHFQAVAIGTNIYAIGVFTGGFPSETTLSSIYVYDTITGTWNSAATMPAARLRGSAGTVVKDGKIYLVGGNTMGHSGGAVAWFDEYDPATDEWRVLPDAPHARDHFQAVLINNQLIAAGGRTTDMPNAFDKPVAATDIYNFSTGSWTAGSPLPTARAGTISVVIDQEVMVVGGEINTSSTALDVVEIYNPATNLWRTLQPLNLGRHSGGGVILGNTLHMVAGSLNKGGHPESSSHETLALDGISTVDTDQDSVSDTDEIYNLGTDPNDSDSDDDGLEDGLEVALGTNPLSADTDGDSLDDYYEVNVQGTNPTLVDSDADGLDDDLELAFGFPPLNPDADNDELLDGQEVNVYFSDPLLADTDGDGLTDGAEVALHGSSPVLLDTDSDNLDDYQEINQYQTDPTDADSDDDSLSDSTEILFYETDPLKFDSDDDGLSDGIEIMFYHTDPNNPDSDEDSVQDGAEIEFGTDPNHAETDSDVIPDTDGDGPVNTPTNSSGGAVDWWILLLLSAGWLQRRCKSSS